MKIKLKKTKNAFAHAIKEAAERAEEEEEGKKKKTAHKLPMLMLRLTSLSFFLNTPNLMHFALQSAPYYKHRVFFDTVCPKANHSRSNSNI